MGLLKKLLGSAASKPEPPEPQESAKPAATQENVKPPLLINQGENDPPLKVDPASIAYAFIGLTHGDASLAERFDSIEQISELNSTCQPRLWKARFRAKFNVFCAPAMENGYPDAKAVRSAAEGSGLKPPYSVVINLMTVSLDGGRTHKKLLVGFAYRDSEQKIVLPRNDGCIPA